MNQYDKRSIEFICGPFANDCSAAYRDWVGVLQKDFDSLAENGHANSFNDHNVLGFNWEKMISQVKIAEDNLKSFSTAI